MTSPSLAPEKLLRWITVLIRVGLGAIFLYAGAVKATASESFALALVPFSILPDAWIGTFAVVLAWTEIAAGILILLPKVHRLGSALILLLALTFIGVLTWALANDIIVSCGCFGQDETPSAAAMQMAILRDAGIAAAAAFALAFRPAEGRRRDRSGSPGSGGR
jgi:uncharacterized membrane protein YphA (DoxX/SURF4 family)